MVVIVLGFIPKYLAMKTTLLLLCYACGVAGRKGGSVFNSDSKNKVILMNKGILISFSK